MDEYIKREELALKVKRNLMPNVDVDGTVSVENAERYFLNLLAEQPVADVVEVKHGYWVEYQIPNLVCCSECDWGTGVEEKFFKYCPNCGAKMDLKEGAEK